MSSSSNPTSNAKKKGSSKTLSLADFHNDRDDTSAVASADLSWAEDKHNPDDSKEDHGRKEEFQRERAIASHAVTSKVFDFRNRDGGSESQNAVSSSGTPIPTTGPFIVFLKNLPSNSVDSSVGTATTAKLEKQLGEKMGIIPIRSRVIVKGISAIAFLEVSTRHDMTLLLAMKNLSFAGRLLPVDVANESQRTDPGRLFDPFCSGPSSSPAAPNPQQGSTVSSVERTASKSSFGRGGGGRGSGSGSFRKSPAGSMSNWTRESEGDGGDASANVSFSGNSPSLGSALKTSQQVANNRNDTTTTRVHSNNGSATGAGTSPSKTVPLAAPSSKAWRPSGKAVRFANESSGGPALGEINYDSSGSQSINNSFSSTPSQLGTAQLLGSSELLWRHRHRALIGGLNDTVTAHDLRRLFEDVGLTVIAVEAVPVSENESPTAATATTTSCKSMYMEVGDEEQLKHVLCQHGTKIKGIEMTITLPPPAQQQERKGSDRGVRRSFSEDPASAFLTRALAAEEALRNMDYDEAAKREENAGVLEERDSRLGGRSEKEEKTDRLRQTTFAPFGSLITSVERPPYDDDDDVCDHDDCEDNRYYYYATRRNQQFSDKLHASGGGDSDYGSRWGIGEEEDTNTILTGYSLRGNASNTNKSTAANTFIGEDDVDYLREGVGDEDSLPLREDGGDEEGQQLRQLSARTSSRASPDGRGRSASRTMREKDRHQLRGLSGMEFTHMTITDAQRSAGTLSGSQTAIVVPERMLTSPSAPRPPNSPFIRSQTFTGSAFAPSNVATAAASSVGEDVSTYMHSDEEEEMAEVGPKKVAFEFETHETDITHHFAKAPTLMDGHNHEVSVIVATSSTRRVEFSIPADHETRTLDSVAANNNVQELLAHIVVEKAPYEEDKASAFDHRHVGGKDISVTSSRLSREASSEGAVDNHKLVNTSSLQSSCGCTPPTRLATASGTIDVEAGEDERERERGLSVTPRGANETTPPTIAKREREAREGGGVPRPTPFNLDGEHIHVIANAKTEADREADNASAGTYPYEDRQVSCDIFDDAAEDNTAREQVEQRMNNSKPKMPSAPPRPIAAASPNEPLGDNMSSQMQSPHPAGPNTKGTRWCVYVGNLRTGTTAQEVSDFFSGKPTSTSGSPSTSSKQGAQAEACIGVEALVVRMRTNAKCTFAFVDVPSEEALRKCVASSGIIFNGRPARIVPAKHAYHHGHDTVIGFSNNKAATPNSPPLVKTVVRSSHPPLAPKPVLASSQPDESEDATVLRDDDARHMGMGMQRASTSLDVEMHVSPSGESSTATNDKVIRVDSNSLVSSREDSNSQFRVPIVSTAPQAPQTSPCPKAAASPPPPPPEALLSVNRQSPSLAPSSGRSSILSRPSPPLQQQPYNSKLGNFSLPPSAASGPTTFSHSPWQVGASQYQRTGENGGLNRSGHINSYSAAAARARAAASAQCPSNAAVEALMKDPVMESQGSSVVMLGAAGWQPHETKPKASQCRHCVYVGNLPTGTTVDDVRSFFDQVMGFFPLVVRIRSNEKSTFAFVDVSSEEELHHAVSKNGSVTLGSRPLRIRRSQTAY